MRHRDGSSAPPELIVPMKAVIGQLPKGPGWRFEVKWDGMRAPARLDPAADPKTKLWSGNRIDVTVRFPELAELYRAVGNCRAVIDGEIVALDHDGRPSFSLMQTRMHVDRRSEAVRRAAEVPVTYVAFDLLWLEGNDIAALPFTARRAALDDVFEPGDHWRLSTIHDDGEALLEAVTAMGLEGVMAKRVDSPYQPGARSSHWRKIKARLHDEFVVGGWTEGEHGRRGQIGALHIGYYRDGSLVYAGRVGSGLTQTELRLLASRFAATARDTSPFSEGALTRAEARRAHWVEPELVVEVGYTGWTNDLKLRHPVYLGRRIDKAPTDVRRP